MLPAGLPQSLTSQVLAACPAARPPEELAAAELLEEAACGMDTNSGVFVVDSSPYLEGDRDVKCERRNGLGKRPKPPKPPGRGEGVSRNSPLEPKDAATRRLGVVIGVVPSHAGGAGELKPA